ncbi:AAA family ATPase [Pediococcus pentosaceus]|uniref:AAA family ATPase n=1 Tax=Pediococcus pentosaceus TaxID=1255 RepID=UPI000DF9ADD9|nr:excinuclease ABC subunit UvrA [Pediococcus pentosaceus]KAF0518989.1 ATP-binding cassette domain-containing protein [Pediococcus pentosaceus]MBF7111789.1 excinuclease ABC subunit UvrA [Pediococcus pentosaceus]MBF7116766.1 excinuclease ABC subunit UvrA [Pediococcus pentosaceus]MBF7118506.1 excinuclease ABC subunit UvrA [Pediococcus pentosaceus]MCS8574712.1 excinuclease ABC subunit UvrA [Pediococcus pentosaceus]
MHSKVDQIEVRGGNVHNLKNINVNIPLNQFVAISGPSGSGKSSLAMGILYAEGSRRYLEALSTYTRRRINQNKRSQVQEVRHIPSAIALRQRPSVPSERSTVGSMSELFNVVRLIFSRLGSTVCPNGHRIQPSLEIAQSMDLPGGTDSRMGIITCPTCGIEFMAKSAEDFAFNSGGACVECHGTGRVRELDESKLIGDENQTLAEGAVASWHLPGRNFMPTVAETLGVRINVPYKDLTPHEKNIVLHGEKKQYAVDFRTSTGRVFHTDKTLYENAYEAVYDSLKTVKSDRAIKRVNDFFHFSTCPTCHGSRLKPELLTQLVGGLNIAEVSDLTLGELPDWQKKTQKALPDEMQAMANVLFKELVDTLRPLLELGLDYLALSRNGNSLSTGELQRIQLAKTLRTETTGVLYVLDEPSIGLHPDNIKGLINIFKALIEQGNSLVVVDHEVAIIEAADWVIEIGPGSGDAGGRIIAEDTPENLRKNPDSLIGPFMTGKANIMHDKVPATSQNEELNTQLTVKNYFNLKDINVTIPGNEITAVTGFSGAGKTSLILDSLVPAIEARANRQAVPQQVKSLETKLTNVVSVDAKPIGKNSRSSLATYTSIMDNLRRMFANLPESKEKHYGIAYFSYNNKQGACEHCGGVGSISLDIQYLPDMEEVCPYCNGTRFKPEIQKILWQGYSIVDLLNLSVKEALVVFKDVPKIEKQLKLLAEIGLDYLHLGESTPSLSGGEAQRLKLVNHLNKTQKETLFVFDEPSVGLHPRDVQTLLGVINQLKQKGATIIIITHDLDLMANADYMIDLGPKGGAAGGQLMGSGAPKELVQQSQSLTVSYLKQHFEKFGMLD